MGAPGTVIGSDPSLNQPKPQPGADPPEAQKGMLDATCTTPAPSATANVTTSSRASTAVTGAPGVVVTLSAGLGWTDIGTPFQSGRRGRSVAGHLDDVDLKCQLQQ